jgi:hypothetical protein
MKTSIATVSISGTFAEKLGAIATAGFDGIEIFEQDFIASDFTPAGCAIMGLKSPCSSPSVISKACLNPTAPAPLPAPRASLT